MKRAVALIALLTAVAAPCGAARAASPFGEAVRFFEGADDEEAALLFRQIVAQAPGGVEAARAHLYLGLIALNAIDQNAALAEFRQALQIDALLELPAHASPKARIVFDDARRARLAQGLGQTNPPPASTVSSEAPREGGARLVPSLASFGAAAASLAVAVGFGVASHQADQSLATAHTTDPPMTAPAAQTFSQQAGTDGKVADVLFGVAGLGAIVGAVFLIGELSSGSSASSPAPRAAVTPLRDGLAVSVGGVF